MRRILQLPVRHDDLFTGRIAGQIPYHRMYGKQYCLPALTVYGQKEMEELIYAAEAVDAIYRKVLAFVQEYMPDSYLTGPLGIHPGLLRAARTPVPYGGITRQDWIIGEQGMKCIENNTDTPTGIPEAAYLEGELVRLAASLALTSPSQGMNKQLRETLSALIGLYRDQGLDGKVFFTCYDWHTEDRMNTCYLMRMCEEAGFAAAYAPLEELEIIPDEGLFHRGELIRILYRLYPLEYLIHDRETESGLEVGHELIRLVEQGRLGLMNPPQHMITQSKGFMATVWSLYERNEQTPEFCGFRLFDDSELEIIRTYLLPTYFDAAPFEQTGTAYAAKGIWGREGKGTMLMNDSCGEVDEGRSRVETGTLTAEKAAESAEAEAYYNEQPKVYQHYWPMQGAEVATEEGLYKGHLLTGIFVAGGRFAGVLPRIGEKVTGDMAYYCAAVVEPEGG
ncbi:glutathionylspermidine synthase family protein [Paenibacillus sp. P96]|uniref:Glutathionylspermidine synthase family protein n=1 Tax=Paenibacillus zeirhizosphaerae TaxID=2987519 RepID=A0ABT9FUZ7_9BACL|nr:glutathionylspermidine synthase family protein [Paenibacillus sp. P96]MDP4098554.1 glutathionylspermidine synthase family protein [Paenibacillus sp. P96]